LAATFTPIASITLNATTASVTFSSIPQTYTDLILITAGTATGSSQLMMQFNGVTTSTYSATILSGNGSRATSVRYSSATSMQLGYDDYFTSGQTVATTHIMNYTNATTNKTVLNRTSNAAVGVGLSVGLSRSTSAVTSITAFPQGSSWGSGTTFNLYGIQAGNA
jgi:hypothetical protein